MDELETRLLNLPLKGPSDALDRKVFAAAGIRPASPLPTRRTSLFRSDWSLARMASAVLLAAALISMDLQGQVEHLCEPQSKKPLTKRRPKKR
jgi:hypothetical protein